MWHLEMFCTMSGTKNCTAGRFFGLYHLALRRTRALSLTVFNIFYCSRTKVRFFNDIGLLTENLPPNTSKRDGIIFASHSPSASHPTKFRFFGSINPCFCCTSSPKTRIIYESSRGCIILRYISKSLNGLLLWSNPREATSYKHLHIRKDLKVR